MKVRLLKTITINGQEIPADTEGVLLGITNSVNAYYVDQKPKSDNYYYLVQFSGTEVLIAKSQAKIL